jgi:hypothetical protein
LNHSIDSPVLDGMQKFAVRPAMAAGLLALAGLPAFAQTTRVVTLDNLRPRELRSTVFTLASPQDLRVQAVGSEPESVRGTFSWITAMWNKDDQKRRDPWIGNAWILDLASRRVVWELSAASTERGHRGTRTFDGTVRLPAGTYEAFYSSYSNVYWTDDQGNQTAGQRFVNWFSDLGLDEFKLAIQGNAQVLSGGDADRARHAIENGALVAFRGDGPEEYLQTGFALDRPTELELYVEGEAREDGEFDTGWIINADTHEKVWKMTWRDSAPAGGAAKNRMARVTRTLPAGRYAAFYATDDTHDPHEWNSPPPHDPSAWGMVVRIVNPAARASVKTFVYEHVPGAATIVALTGVGNGESRSRGFTVTRPMDVRIYALGEGREGRMFDYGWITAASTHQKIWQMRYDQTEHAGGDPKNRLVDRTIRLDKGDYIVHYVSDDSHSAAGWNAPAPADGRHWGITLLAASGRLDRGIVSEYVARPDPTIIAQLVRIRDGESPRKPFTLDRETQVRVYALGESSGRTMADHGWIEDAKTGRAVWEMTYRTTESAGGAAKNRKFDGAITLPAGQYVLRYETDDSHAFGSWNAAPPDDPEMWGITLYRVR